MQACTEWNAIYTVSTWPDHPWLVSGNVEALAPAALMYDSSMIREMRGKTMTIMMCFPISMFSNITSGIVFT